MRIWMLAAMAALGMAGQAGAATINPHRLVLDFGDRGWGVLTEDGRNIFRLDDRWTVAPSIPFWEWFQGTTEEFTYHTFNDLVDESYFFAISGGSEWTTYRPEYGPEQLGYGALLLGGRWGRGSWLLPVLDYSFAPVPVPAAAPMLMTGAVALWAVRRRGRASRG